MQSSAADFPGPHFRATQSMTIYDIESKSKSGLSVESDEFSSSTDRRPVFFKMVLQFGNGIYANFLNAHVQPLNRNLRFTRLKITLTRDDEVLANLDSYKASAPVRWRHNYGWTRSPITPITPFDNAWEASCELEYVRLTPEEEELLPIGRGPKMENYLWRVFQNSEDSDVTFVVQGEPIHAHKIYLASGCCYFDKLFEIGKVVDPIEISDISPKVFRELLRFIYAAFRVKYQEHFTEALQDAAAMYGVSELQILCANAICDQFNQSQSQPRK